VNKALILVMKNKYRGQVKFLVSNIFIIITFIVFLIIAINFLPEIVLFLRNNILYFNIFISCFLLFIYFLRKYPPIILNPATIHFLSWNSAALKAIVGIKFIALIFMFLLSAIILTFISHEVFYIYYFAHLLSLLTSFALLSWRKYHISSFKWYSFFLFVTLALMFILSFHIIGIVINVVISVWAIGSQIKWNIFKFLSDMSFIYKTNAAAARANHVEMLTIIAQKETNERYSIPYPKKTKYPLIAKSVIINGFRVPMFAWIMKVWFIIGAIVMYHIPLILGLNSIIFIGALSLYVHSFIKENVLSSLSLQAKNNLGLFVPYTRKKIALDYTIYPSIAISVLFLMLFLFTSISFLKLLVVLVTCCVMTYLWHLLALKFPEKSRIIELILGVIVSSILFLLII